MEENNIMSTIMGLAEEEKKDLTTEEFEAKLEFGREAFRTDVLALKTSFDSVLEEGPTAFLSFMESWMSMLAEILPEDGMDKYCEVLKGLISN